METFPLIAKTIPGLEGVLAEELEWQTHWKDHAAELRRLHAERERDEALLRQALEALERAHRTAMEQTLKARIPECAEFAGIAQDLDFVVAALRVRLGEKEQR